MLRLPAAAIEARGSRLICNSPAEPTCKLTVQASPSSDAAGGMHDARGEMHLSRKVGGLGSLPIGSTGCDEISSMLCTGCHQRTGEPPPGPYCVPRLGVPTDGPSRILDCAGACAASRLGAILPQSPVLHAELCTRLICSKPRPVHTLTVRNLPGVAKALRRPSCCLLAVHAGRTARFRRATRLICSVPREPAPIVIDTAGRGLLTSGGVETRSSVGKLSLFASNLRRRITSSMADADVSRNASFIALALSALPFNLRTSSPTSKTGCARSFRTAAENASPPASMRLMRGGALLGGATTSCELPSQRKGLP